MAETWRSAGIDSVSIENYKILLDYPNSTDPNLIRSFIKLLAEVPGVVRGILEKNWIMKTNIFIFLAYAIPGVLKNSTVWPAIASTNIWAKSFVIN